jgi:hypothetical protein
MRHPLDELEWGSVEPSDMSDEQCYEWLSSTWGAETQKQAQGLIDVFGVETTALMAAPPGMPQEHREAVVRGLTYMMDQT